MKVNVAEHCGFCAGVKNAILIALKQTKTASRIVMLGDLVHNQTVMDDLRKKGLTPITSLDQAKDSPLLLRAHGTEKQIIKKAQDMGIALIDATCPLVKEIHNKSLELEAEGRQVFIVGDKQHDEVRGIASNLKDPVIISSPEDLNGVSIKKKCGVVVQSTQFESNLQDIVSILLTKSADCRIINTICMPTKRNRLELVELAEQNEILLVIGDKKSANSKRLYELALKLNPQSYMISDIKDINTAWFENIESVGITAGASTPDNTINRVKKYVINLSHGE